MSAALARLNKWAQDRERLGDLIKSALRAAKVNTQTIGGETIAIIDGEHYRITLTPIERTH